MSSKRPDADLRRQYPYVLEKAVVIALALHLLAILTIPSLKIEPYRRTEGLEVVHLEDIPEVQQAPIPPPPARPSIAVEMESEDIPELLPVVDTDPDVPEPPPSIHPGPEEVIPESFDIPPKPVLLVNPLFPEDVRKGDIEEVVVLKILIDEEGNVVDARAEQNPELPRLLEAAVTAVMQWKFTPAYFRGKPVKLWQIHEIRFSEGSK